MCVTVYMWVDIYYFQTTRRRLFKEIQKSSHFDDDVIILFLTCIRRIAKGFEY